MYMVVDSEWGYVVTYRRIICMFLASTYVFRISHIRHDTILILLWIRHPRLCSKAPFPRFDINGHPLLTAITICRVFFFLLYIKFVCVCSSTCCCVVTGAALYYTMNFVHLHYKLAGTLFNLIKRFMKLSKDRISF